jgi:hypothetical protein
MSEARQEEESKQFFFEKKNQKTLFIGRARCGNARA